MTQQPEEKTAIAPEASEKPTPKDAKRASELNEQQLDSVAGGVDQPRNIGSQSTGAGAGKVTFNPF